MDKQELVKDIKRNIKNYIRYTKKLNEKKYDKSMKQMFQMIFNLSAHNLKDFADNYTPIYLEVIDGLKIQSQLDECILINQKKQKGGK